MKNEVVQAHQLFINKNSSNENAAYWVHTLLFEYRENDESCIFFRGRDATFRASDCDNRAMILCRVEAKQDLWDRLSGYGFQVHKEGKTWNEANNHCTESGGSLVIGDNVKSPKISSEKLANWVGGRRVDGEFQWIDGNKINKASEDWQKDVDPTIPDICLAMSQGKLTPMACNGTLPFICEKWFD
ncbi:hypothetical protein L596_019884 [Steinernema carpocapsae]|nr:hypothetical protein L596_019884 [Steinernema carpocapsae]